MLAERKYLARPEQVAGLEKRESLEKRETWYFLYCIY